MNPRHRDSNPSFGKVMSLKQNIGKGVKAGYGSGRHLQGIRRAVSIAPKHDSHSLGHQPGNQGKNGQMGKQKGNGMARSKSIIPPLCQTFKSRGYINSSLSMECEDVVTPFLTLTINATTKDEEMIESACPTVFPCPRDFELNN